MSTIPVQNLIIDNDTDIGLTSDLINGTYKSSSLTDLSNNVYSKITDLSSNVYSKITDLESNIDTQLNEKQPMLTQTTNLLGIGSNITGLSYDNISINKPDLFVYAIKSKVDTSFNAITATLTNKQNIFTCIEPLIKNDISNNISIDLSSYVLKSTFDSSVNTLSDNLFNFYLIANSQNTDLSSNVYLKITDLSSNVYSKITDLENNVNTQQNIISVSTPLIKDISNNISIDLSSYPLKSYVDASLNTINTTLSNKQNTLTAVTPLIKDVNNHIFIDLSGYPLKSYVDASLNTINTNKQNIFSCIAPLIKNDSSNNISIDLSSYVLKTTFDSSLNTINTNKQNIFTCISPLIKNDISNNIRIDLSGYVLKTTFDSSLNTINTNKQNNLTFSNPFLNTSNTISLKINPAQFNIDASGNLSLIGVASQWTTSGTNIYYNTGNVGLGIANPNTKLHIEHNSTTFNAANGGLYVHNPNNTTGSSSVLGARIGGSTANKAGISLDVSNNYGWSIYINGNDTADKYLRFNSGWDASGSERLQIRGSDGYTKINGSCDIAGKANIHNGSPDLLRGINFMQSGSLTIGGTNANYGGNFYTGGVWSGTNTAGLLLECLDNTEIVVHDYNNKLSSLMYYEGGTTNKITIGRNMGLGAINNIVLNGNTGIGITNPNCRLYISSNLATSATVFTMRLSCGATSDNGGFGTLLGLGSEANGWSKCAIGHMRTGTYDQGDIVFLTRATGDNADCTMSDVRMRIKSNGEVQCSGILTASGTINANGIINASGTINANGNKLNFPNTLDQYKINLWGTNQYGFGIASSTLQYTSSGNHSFYHSGNGVSTFTITNVGNVSCVGSIDCVGVSASGGMRIGSNLGIQNSSPLSMLHLGNCTVANSNPVIVFGKNVNGTGYRNAFIGYNDSFFFIIGDYGNTNTSNTLTSQLAIIYNAPASSLVIQASGYVRMQYGYGTSSDERLKTGIKTVEHALDKTLLLRGVEYNDIRIEPERKRIGLIAQEVELIVPEVVRTGDDGIKSIEYQNLVPLLIEAIKDQQKQINELKNILKNNNLY